MNPCLLQVAVMQMFCSNQRLGGFESLNILQEPKIGRFLCLEASCAHSRHNLSKWLLQLQMSRRCRLIAQTSFLKKTCNGMILTVLKSNPMNLSTMSSERVKYNWIHPSGAQTPCKLVDMFNFKQICTKNAKKADLRVHIS